MYYLHCKLTYAYQIQNYLINLTIIKAIFSLNIFTNANNILFSNMLTGRHLLYNLKLRSLCGLEMLSLSVGQTQRDATRVQFDDTCWQRHAASLRPLGLAVQLALCDPQISTRMLRLSDHLTHAALVCTRPPCQPVRPPWSLCNLPRILGKIVTFIVLVIFMASSTK